jgi:hypothetical protein
LLPDTKSKKEFIDLLDQLIKAYPNAIAPAQISGTCLILLNLFSIIEEERDQLKISNQTAKNFALSLRTYILEDLKLISNWEIHPSSSGENIFESGVRFLKAIEDRRVHKLGSKTHLREVKNISLVIKARLEGLKDPVYLFQFDPESLMLKPIGGQVDQSQSIEDQIQTLVKKELGLNNLTTKNYSFREISSPVDVFKVSNHQGIYTKHQILFYFLDLGISNLKLSSLDRWIHLKDLMQYETNDGVEVLSYFRYLVDKEKFIEILQELPLSLKKDQELKNFINQKVVNEKQPKSQLDKYLNSEESEILEFKSSLRWDYKQNSPNKVLERVISKTLAAFLNSQGGTLLIGVDDDKSILGIQKDLDTLQKKNLDGFMQFIIAMVSTSMGVEFCGFIDIHFEEKDSKQVCILNVKKSPQPVFYKDGNNREFYTRAGNTTRALNIEEIYKYIQLNW